jgi:membrane protein DedA with SNARE-associated domain
MTPLALALATLVSEDLACLTAGLLVAEGKLSFLSATWACFLGILIGDLLLFAAGRWPGRTLLGIPYLKRRISEERLEQSSQWLRERGFTAVVVSRLVPGLRLPTYFAAGLLRTSAARFALHFTIACALWTPLLVGSAAWFGGMLGRWSLPLFAAAILIARSHRLRRRLVGFVLRKVRWEFWPIWAVYLPLLPYLLYLAVRYRSTMVFTLANPTIPTGGLVGESKAAILTHLRAAASHVPPFATARNAAEAIAAGIGLPFVLKPDQGERGKAVAIARTSADVEAYFQHPRGRTIVQPYIEGLEFGLYYARHPEAPAGQLLGITWKQFPVLTGDGKRTVGQLILDDPRAVCLAQGYLRTCRRDPASIPAPGERIVLAEIGAHSRGSIFVDAGHLHTAALEATVDCVTRAHPTFHLGRFDVRTPSIEHLQRGEFQVLELNGIGGEPVHMYDARHSYAYGWRALARHWRLAFAFGDVNRRRNQAECGSIAEMLRLAYRDGGRV